MSDESDTPQTKKTKGDRKTAVRKRPGRPRKPPKHNMEKKGIVDKPFYDCNRVFEAVYCEPLTASKIKTIKKLNISHILIKVDAAANKIYMYGMHDHKKHHCLITFHGDKLHSFYAPSDFEITIESKVLLKVLTTVNKNHTKFVIGCKDRSEKKLSITLVKDEAGSIITHDIRTSSQTVTIPPNIAEAFLYDDYNLQIQWGHYDFKSDCKTMSDFASQTHLTQIPGSLPEFEFKQPDGHVTSSITLDKKTNSVIRGVTVPFSLSMDTKLLVSAAGVGLGSPNILIRSSMNHKFSILHTLEDGAISMNILTETLDNRPDELKNEDLKTIDNPESDSEAEIENNSDDEVSNKQPKQKITKHFKFDSESDVDVDADESNNKVLVKLVDKSQLLAELEEAL
jgi:hypothetical protein